MDRHYSTLELVRYDDTARAPERDYDATAFELDGAALAPQAVPDETPQVVYDSSLPEAQGHEESTEKRTSSLHITKTALKWPWIVIALLITVVVAVGVAFGVWSRRDHSSHNLSAVTSPPVSQNHSITPTKQFILNDTSLAATSDPNGDRYLFFQDTAGLIRGMRYISNLDTWRASLNIGTNSSAKKYTPLAATTFNFEGQGTLQITVYYVSESYSLNSSTYTEGFWLPDIQPGDLSLGKFSTAVTTRSLSIVEIGVSPPSNWSSVDLDSLDRSLLYYEDPTGRISVLSHQAVGNEKNRTLEERSPAEWVNLTSQESKSLPDEFRNTPASIASKTLYESLGTNTTLRAPFTCGANWTVVDEDNLSVGALFYSPQPNASNSQFAIQIYTMGPGDSVGNFTGESEDFGDLISTQNRVQDFSPITQSDIALFGIANAVWINHTQPTVLDPTFGVTPPNNTFPFSRLASITSADFAYTYLYHQINGTTFAEEQWDSNTQIWTTTYIPVSY